MPIEFDCPQCRNRLRVPDGSEGRAAICPECSQQVAVPDEFGSAATPEGVPSSPPSGQGAADGPVNPYASPTSSTDSPQPVNSSELTPTLITFSDILGTTWRVFRANLMQFVLLGAILIAMYIGGGIVSAPLSFISGMAAEQQNFGLLIGINLLSIAWGQIYGAFCIAVGIRYTLDVVAGVKDPFNSAFKVWPYFWKVLFAQLICALLASVGAAVCAIPIIPILAMSNGGPEVLIPTITVCVILAVIVYMIIMSRVCITIPFVMDRNQSVTEAISNSMTYTKGNGLAIVLTFLLTWLGMMFFIVFTCFLGSIVAMPFGLTMIVVIYRLATGQRIADDGTRFASPTAS